MKQEMETVNAKEAAKQLGISYQTLRKLIHSGEIKFEETKGQGPTGINYLVPLSEVARYMPAGDIALSTQDAADAMGVHQNTVYYMIKTGKLKALPVPSAGTGKYKLARVAASEVERYLAAKGQELT